MKKPFVFLLTIPLLITAMMGNALASDFISYRLLDSKGIKIQMPTHRIIYNQDKWQSFYKNVTTENTSPPFVNFNTEQAVIVASGTKSSSGYQVLISGVYQTAKVIHVNVTLINPGFLCNTLQVITYPSAVFAIPKNKKPFRFHIENSYKQCN